jgi:hypothetical protein
VRRWLKSRDPAQLALAGVVALFVLRGLFYLTFVPIWDAQLYAGCVEDATHPFVLGHLNCFNHPSLGYLFFHALTRLLIGARPAAYLLVNLGMGAAALVGFHRVLELICPLEGLAPERLLTTALLSVHPVLMASAVHLNPDFGVAVFFIGFLWGLLEARAVLSSVLGVLLVMSKESGPVVFGAAVVWYVLLWRTCPRNAGRRLSIHATAAVCVLPAAAVAAFLYWKLAHHQGSLFLGNTTSSLISLAVVFRLSATIEAYLVGIGALSFMWIPTLVIIAAPTAWLLCGVIGPKRPAGPFSSNVVAFLSALLLTSTYALTRFETFVNVRYFLVLAPIILTLFYVASERLIAHGATRRVLLGVCCVLFLASNYRTIDPVSQAYFGTFSFGSHEVLDMTAPTGECCGNGRDQLVYNLEFTKLGDLQEAIFADLHPSDSTVFVAHTLADFHLLTPLGRDFKRTLSRRRLVFVGARTPEEIETATERPREIHYIEFPNFDNASALARLEKMYKVVGSKDYLERGYALRVHHMVLK